MFARRNASFKTSAASHAHYHLFREPFRRSVELMPPPLGPLIVVRDEKSNDTTGAGRSLLACGRLLACYSGCAFKHVRRLGLCTARAWVVKFKDDVPWRCGHVTFANDSLCSRCCLALDIEPTNQYRDSQH